VALHPTLNAILICDLTIREERTGKVSLVGVFENIAAAAFPIVHHRLSLYAQLTDAAGEYDVRVDLVRLDDTRTVAEGRMKAAFADRMTPGELIFTFENLPFERPGRYEFRLHANERWVASKSFMVMHAPAKAAAPPA
jgi:uncharacterized protein DUF6941